MNVSDLDEEMVILLSLSRGAESRRRILECLNLRPQNCSQIAKHLSLDWWTVQKHLHVLSSKGIICNSNIGRIKYYRISPTHKKTINKVLT